MKKSSYKRLPDLGYSRKPPPFGHKTIKKEGRFQFGLVKVWKGQCDG